MVLTLLDPMSSPSWGHSYGLEVAQPPKLDGIRECADNILLSSVWLSLTSVPFTTGIK